jgi:hypothetical protein
VTGESWDAKADLVARSILDLGLAFEGRAISTSGQAA